VIVSPEFGERIDLDRLTRDVMGRMGQDLGTTLDWAAVAHFNTEHPCISLCAVAATMGSLWTWIETISGMVYGTSSKTTAHGNWVIGHGWTRRRQRVVKLSPPGSHRSTVRFSG
jgi:hypothetical protein